MSRLLIINIAFLLIMTFGIKFCLEHILGNSLDDKFVWLLLFTILVKLQVTVK